MTTKIEQKYQLIAAGLGKLFPANATTTLSGKAWTGQQLVQFFQAVVAALNAITTARAEVVQAEQAWKTQAPAAQATYLALGDVLRAQLGKGNPLLATLGYKTGARRPPSPETVTLAKAKRLATRKARGTLGRKQRLGITATPQPQLLILGPDGKPLGK